MSEDQNIFELPSSNKDKVVSSDDLDFFLNWNAQDLHSQYEKICDEIERNWKFPTAPIFNLIKHKVRLEHELGLYQESALTMLQSQGLSFRHQALNQYYKRLEIQKSSKNSEKNNQDTDLTEMHQKLLEFQDSLSKNSESVLELIKELPDDWRVIQLSVNDLHSDSRFKKTPADQAVLKNLSLKLVAIQCGEKFDISIHDIAQLPDQDKMPSLQKELQDILSKHNSLYKSDKENSAKYKKLKEEIDNRMDSLVQVIENKWLGFKKVLLLGKTDADHEISKLCDNIQGRYFAKEKNFTQSGKRQLLHKILDGHEYLSENQLFKALNYFSHESGFHSYVKDLLPLVPTNETFTEGIRRKPTVLILDKEIQGLPWESMEFLKGHPMSRVPSFHTLALLYKAYNHKDTAKPGQIRQEKIFYVLNPEQNLPKTQERLEPTLAEMNIGTGKIGEQPSLPEMRKVFSEMDAYMYMGHGSTLKNFSAQEIEKLNVRAVPLLFGCNSGKLERMGRLMDPIGTVNSYLIATAPSLLGFLWSITDRDLDQWTVKFLRYWLGEEQPEFVQAVADKKPAFSRMITKAAVVIYGLPSLNYTTTTQNSVNK